MSRKQLRGGDTQSNGLVDSSLSSGDNSSNSSNCSSLASVNSDFSIQPPRADNDDRAAPAAAASTGTFGKASPTSPQLPSLRPSPNSQSLSPPVGGRWSGKGPAVTSPSRTRRSQKRGGSATPARVLVDMHGSVMPENNGTLPKVGHIAVCYEQAIYVFGGVNGKGHFNNHVFCHEKRTLAWREIRGIGVVPRGRVNHAAALVGSKIYVHGGHRQLEIFDDMFAYDLESSRWEKVSYEQSQGPGGVFLHTMLHVPSSDSLFVLGGVHHREQNSYVGHLFDIRNRVWSGVPPPPSVNPQYLQFVSAAYHTLSGGVVVLGMTEAAVMHGDYVTVPHVYIFQPQSFLWKRVETPTAPESPLPFRMEAIWDTFMHHLVVSGGGFYDEVLQHWMFPFPLPNNRRRNPATTAAANANQVDATVPPVPSNKLGFLCLDLKEMTWSLVLCHFPRKLLAEVNAYNAAEHEKMERAHVRANVVAANVKTTQLGKSAARRPSPPQPQLQQQQSGSAATESGVLNLSNLSLSAANTANSNGAAGGGLSQNVRKGTRDSASIGASMSNVTWGSGVMGGAAASTLGSSAAPSGRRSSGGAADGAERYRRLVSFYGAPEFMRKYVMVAVREAPRSAGKLRPIQYLVLHGGLSEPNDHSMLMFVPKLARVDALAATKQNGQLAELVRTASYRAVRSGRAASANSSREKENGEAERDRAADRDEEAAVGDERDESNDLADTGLTAAALRGDPSRAAGGPGSVASASSVGEQDADSASVSQNYQYSLGEGDGDDGQDEAAMQRSFLLPTLPSERTSRNYHRFALQYTPQNSVQSESLLPYIDIPVAVLQTQQDVQKWSRTYYGDQRRWLADKMKDAVAEARKLRKMRRVALARAAQAAVAAGRDRSNSSPHNSFLLSDGFSDGETDSLMESLYVMESLTSLPRGLRPGDRMSTAMLAYEDQLAADAATARAAAVDNEAPQRRVQDFFEERHLEPFVTEDVTQLPRKKESKANGSTTNNGGSIRSDRDGKGRKKRKNGLAEKTAAGSQQKGNGRSGDAAGQKAGQNPLAATTARSASMSAASVEPVTYAGFERLTIKARRQKGRERLTSLVFQSGTTGALSGGAAAAHDVHTDLASAMSLLLLRNRLERFHADDDSPETCQRKALLRWQYLRALVCTGEAAYILYMVGQAQWKMKGVPVSSTAGLVLAPELHFIGPSHAYKVPSKPVPYNVSAATGVIAAPAATGTNSRVTQLTSSGMVVYHSLR